MAVTSAQFHGIVDVLARVLSFNHPADAVLSHFFRERPKLGGRDRHVIAETVYAALRRFEFLTAVVGEAPNPRRYAIAALLRLMGHNLREIAEHLKDSEKELAGAIKARQPELSPVQQAELPEWLVEGMGLAEDEMLALGRALQHAAPLDLRINSLKTKREAVLERFAAEGIAAEATPHSPLGVRLAEKMPLQKHALFTEGLVEVQDEGSQLLGLMLGARRGEMVVDFCAGAGGKTLLLAAAMANSGRVYAFDVAEKRLNNLAPRLKRSGLSNIQPVLITSETDARVKRLAGKIDRVLVDAPCSGMGTLRRNPDLKFRQSPESVAELNAKQTAILSAAASLLKPGGRLVYATCSLLPSENQAVVQAFLAAHPQFELLPAGEALGRLNEGLDMGDYLQLWPHRHNTDGFFAAALVRKP
ncbi:MAG: RsmB/NOP family class I SAM-dependent RNA methyltransferase [Gammaproteobacteria bacterium]|nr:RsmB/NOP family class I SAM-dependent RNA methyltransferase [Gammaproteobacteria bacterium]